MAISLLGTLTGALLGWLMGFLSLFLILLVLVQRGRGGGLTGALGGPGGQSAFGSKAGDTFTIITVVMASVWGFTCAFTMWLLGTHTSPAVTDTKMTAAPGDEKNDAVNQMILPATGEGGISGFSPLGDDQGAITSETPSQKLTPKPTAADSDASSISPAESEATEPAEPESEGEASDQPSANQDSDK